MINKLRELIFGKKVTISEAAAIQIAKNFCAEKNYKWNEPISIELFRGIYSIWTNRGYRGNNFWVKIDGSDGKIITQGITPY